MGSARAGALMDSRVKFKRKIGGALIIEVRADDLEQMGEDAFYRTLTEKGVEPHMIGERRASKTRPVTWVIQIDETAPTARPADGPGGDATRQLEKGMR